MKKSLVLLTLFVVIGTAGIAWTAGEEYADVPTAEFGSTAIADAGAIWCARYVSDMGRKLADTCAHIEALQESGFYRKDNFDPDQCSSSLAQVRREHERFLRAHKGQEGAGAYHRQLVLQARCFYEIAAKVDLIQHGAKSDADFGSLSCRIPAL